MNFLSIIKDLRQVKVLMNNSLMKSKARQYLIDHTPENIIDCDTDSKITHILESK
jgi:hypothetical protein